MVAELAGRAETMVVYEDYALVGMIDTGKLYSVYLGDFPPQAGNEAKEISGVQIGGLHGVTLFGYDFIKAEESLATAFGGWTGKIVALSALMALITLTT